MTPAELRALAAEVEALTGPSREMDVRIEAALGAKTAVDCYGARTVSIPDERDPDQRTYRDARRFTSSIDAAAALMPEGWNFGVTIRTDEEDVAVTGWYCSPLDGLDATATGMTEPLARTAWALRARAALMEAADAT